MASDAIRDIREDLTVQRRVWISQRVGWVLMTLFVLAGLAGLLGPGPLSSARASTPGGELTIEFDRISRLQAPSRVVLKAEPHGSELRLWVDQRFLESVEIRNIEPQPARVEMSGDRAVLVFPLARAEKATVTLDLEPSRIGRLETSIGMEGGGELRLRQLVLP